MFSSTGVGTATTKNVQPVEVAGSLVISSGVRLELLLGDLVVAIVAALQLLDLLGVDVEADACRELARERERDRQPDVAEADDGDLLSA